MATSHLLLSVRFWVARNVKKGNKWGVDMLLGREMLKDVDCNDGEDSVSQEKDDNEDIVGGVFQLKQSLHEFLRCRIGNGRTASFCYDSWTELGPMGISCVLRNQCNFAYSGMDCFKSNTSWKLYFPPVHFLNAETTSDSYAMMCICGEAVVLVFDGPGKLCSMYGRHIISSISHLPLFFAVGLRNRFTGNQLDIVPSDLVDPHHRTVQTSSSCYCNSSRIICGENVTAGFQTNLFFSGGGFRIIDRSMKDELLSNLPIAVFVSLTLRQKKTTKN
ncbi:hypothetical protein IGI04_041167 [Brassica rapa subsp. trilocularis]|uniref:TLDc domain-containing protein n=1 Tax=Brassica rapa subsp. trilocularis TaxID=1813537 RepID=A0ABQ7KSV5_BRACM|nr:hypothetical protein IGI04_041167 [Brassica rapa subsp. trilocularis]